MSPWVLLTCLALALASCQATHVDDPRTERAEALARVGSWEGAAATWTSIYQDSGASNADAGIGAARALVECQRFGPARTRLEDVVARGIVRDDTRRAEVEELLGRASEGLGIPAEAAEHYEAALGLDARRPIALQRLGSLRLAEGQLDEGLELLGRSLALDPANAETSRRLGLGAAGAGRLDLAAPALDRAMDAGELSAEDVLRLADDFAGDRRVIPWLASLVERDPQNTAALRGLGEAYASTGRGALALSTLERAAETDPGDVRALVAYARALKAASMDAEALGVLDHAQALRLSEAEAALVDGVREEWRAAETEAAAPSRE